MFSWAKVIENTGSKHVNIDTQIDTCLTYLWTNNLHIVYIYIHLVDVPKLGNHSPLKIGLEAMIRIDSDHFGSQTCEITGSSGLALAVI